MMQKYRADQSTAQSDGATLWHALWMGGPSLAKIENCRLDGLAGAMRATVYVIGEPYANAVKGCGRTSGMRCEF